MTAAAAVPLLLASCLLYGVSCGRFDIREGRHNITMGERSLHSIPNNHAVMDSLLYHDSPTMERTLFPYPKVKSHDVCYPTRGSHLGKFTITGFHVIDQVPDGDGGYAFITLGGLGDNKLCLHLKTQRGGRYHFDIDIWGYYN